MISKLTTITGRAIILKEDDIDTDRIIPARFLKCVTFDELGAHVFADDRVQEKQGDYPPLSPLLKGGERGVHPFDDHRYKGASILFTGSNFGCGSSREHAVHALVKWGIRAIVAYGEYSEIFFKNALVNGLPVVLVKRQDWEEIVQKIQEDLIKEVIVDIDNMKLSVDSLKVSITFQQSSARDDFVTGSWDKLGVLFEAGDEIEDVLQRLPYVNYN